MWNPPVLERAGAPPPSPIWRRYLWLWLPPLLLFDLWLLHRLWPRRNAESAPPTPSALLDPSSARPEAPAWTLRFPTEQDRLLDPPNAAVFMPTAAGNIESALYGSTRTGEDNGRIFPTFHEGIDIAPVRRDRRGAALDAVRAVGDGRVAYIQPHAGNSNYGIYVVLFHDDPIGEIYTLYAHLANVSERLRVGQVVAAGEILGRMGNTPAHIVPRARAHLHFEIGLMVNRRFAERNRALRRTPDHGNLHGMNLSGVDPRAAFAARDAEGRFSMADFLPTVPTAFEIVIRAPRRPDYFERYPGLWRGDPWTGEALTLGVSAGDVVLRGRNATAEEIATLAAANTAVAFVDEVVLGRNGRRLIVRDGAGWKLGSNGREWLEILLF